MKLGFITHYSTCSVLENYALNSGKAYYVLSIQPALGVHWDWPSGGGPPISKSKWKLFPELSRCFPQISAQPRGDPTTILFTAPIF